jgi:DHA1 family multidrug resistance protein-like MFS transporter
MTWNESLLEIIRDAPLGQIVRFVTNNAVLQYPEERSDFKLPALWSGEVAEKACQNVSHAALGAPTNTDNLRSEQNTNNGECMTAPDIEKHSSAEQKTTPSTKNITEDGVILIDWYSDNDLANPQNWSSLRRFFVGWLIWIYTVVVYVSSSIYTPSVEGVMERFHVSNLTATLGLAIYVLGYGIGPLLFSPLGEIPRIGRNPVYFITILLFVIFSTPIPFVNSFTGLIILRFLQGFFGSPCLASGGATLGDLYKLEQFPFAMVAWVSAMSCGRK